MTIPGIDLANQGGRFNTALGMLFGTLDANRMGEMHLQSLLHLLALLFYDDKEEVPASGFPRSEVGGTNCTVTSTADLTFDVESGWGLLFDASLIGGDPFGSGSYQMVVLGSGSVGETLVAHDPADPRIDLITLKPKRTGTEPATRNIKDPTTGVLSTAPVDLKDNLDAEVAIITGTPAASPVDPILLAGHLLIARAEVPATAGAATLRDARNVLHVGNFLKGPPGNDNYQANHVHPEGSAGELSVAETSPTSLAVLVGKGRSVIGGTIRLHPRETLTLAAADPVDPRIDVITANRDGTLLVVTGTPAPSPVAPAIPGTAISLAEVDVAALAVLVVNADITDTRRREWLNGTKAIRKGTLDHQSMTVPTVVVKVLSVTTPNPDVKSVNYELQNPDGTVYEGPLPIRVLAEVYQPGVGGNTAGTFVPSSGAASNVTLNPGGLLGTATDFILYPGPSGILNRTEGIATTAGSQSGRMLCEVSAVNFALELCRDTGTTPTGTHYVVCTPLQVTTLDKLPAGEAEWEAVTF